LTRDVDAVVVTVDRGAVTGVTAGDDGVHDADRPQLSGTSEAWDALLSAPPPPGFTDPFAAVGIGRMSLSHPPTDAARHLAIRRFVELCRHAANGTDPSPVVRRSGSRHGQHDAAVGRYLHLDLGGFDHRLYYEEAGQGIGLVCQHTAGSDGRQWRHLLEDERVTSRYRVVVYDLPSHGKSLPPEGRAWWAEPYRLTKEAAMALPVTLAEALGLDRPVFIGSSIGGMLALDLARYHPEAFRAVIALEGGLKVRIPAELGHTEELSFTDEDPALHAAVMMMLMSPTAPEVYRQETRLHYAQGAPGVFNGDIHYYAVDHDLTGEAHLIDTERCAVHLLTGEYDFPTVPWTEEAARAIPGASFRIMTGLGHFPMSEDHDRLMDEILPILDAIAVTSAPAST
jgi:pimeloyl-ACP methyl ester carboxylesterase